MPKTALRRRLLRARRELHPRAVFNLGQRVQRRLLQHKLFGDAQRVLLYSPIHNEVATDLLFRAAARQGKGVLFPRVRGHHLDLVQVMSVSDLHPGAYGIREPVGPGAVPLESVDLIVAPGVGFDRRGYRLGYGKGFYDRLLRSGGFNGVLVGLCYGLQLVDELPVEPHDVPVDCVMTEKEELTFESA